MAPSNALVVAALVVAALVVGLASCAQGRAPSAGHGLAQEPPSAPVQTLGPDDGVPFVRGQAGGQPPVEVSRTGEADARPVSPGKPQPVRR